MPQKLEDLFSPEEIESMSDEEKAAFEEELEGEIEDEETDDQENKDEAKGETAPEEKEKEGESEGDGEGDKEQGAEVKDEPEEGEESPAEKEAPKPEPEPEKKTEEKKPEPEPEPEPDENAEKKEQFQEELKKLREKFEEGEITFEDYLDQRDEVKDTIREIEIQEKLQAAFEADKQAAAKQQAEAKWREDQDRFFKDNDDIKKDSNLFKTFARQANSKITDPEYASVANEDLLKEAADEARAIMGLKKPAKEKEKDLADARKNANKANNKTVTTLANVPASAENEVSNSEFARLDELLEQGKSEEVERILSKMSPEQQERYARA